MLKFILHTARRQPWLFLLAVFFSQPLSAAGPNLPSLSKSFNDLIYDLSGSIVLVETTRRIPAAVGLVGSEASIEHSRATGLVFDSVGHIIVPASVVAGCDQLTVRLAQATLSAQLVGIDYHSGLALLRTAKPLGRAIRLSRGQTCAGEMVIMLGNSDRLRVAPAIGFCAGRRVDGNLQFSLGTGSASAGGGVFDLSGQLLGVLLGEASGGAQAAEALPAFHLPKIIEYLIRNGDRLAGYIGISSVEIEVSPPLELPLGQSSSPGAYLSIQRGVVVTKVVSGSAADLAGMQQGDLIYAYQGRQIRSAAEFAARVVRTYPGEVARLNFIRQHQPIDIQLRIGSKGLLPQPVDPPANPDSSPDKSQSALLASELLELKARVAQLEQLLLEK